MSCADCHDTVGEAFDPEAAGGSGYPDIAEYLSAKWLRDFIAHPGDEQHYGDRNQMPSYAETLTEEELDHPRPLAGGRLLPGGGWGR